MMTRSIHAVVLGFGLVLLFMAGACGGRKNARVASQDGAASPATGHDAAPSTPQGTKDGSLCIDLSDLQIEPLDLEALQDEMPVVDLGGTLGKALERFPVHGTPIPLDGGDFAVPLVSCGAGATGAPLPCSARIAVLDKNGAERSSTPLPDVGEVDRDTEVQFVAALADVDSDGSSDLWVGYQRAGEKGASQSVDRVQHVAAWSLPGLALEWHSVIATSAAGPDEEGCEGAIHPADADCDGDGDIVLLQRCGPMRCLGDEGDGNPGCSTGQKKDRSAIYRWDPKLQRYM